MNAYPKRWEALAKGVSVEHAVRSLATRLTARLSAERGVRCLAYLPILDIDRTDLVLRLTSPTMGWTMYIDVSVRSSCHARMVVGSEQDYSALRQFLTGTPALIFFYDWTTDRLSFFLPNEIRRLTGGYLKKSFAIPPPAENEETTENRLFSLLSSLVDMTLPQVRGVLA